MGWDDCISSAAPNRKSVTLFETPDILITLCKKL